MASRITSTCRPDRSALLPALRETPLQEASVLLLLFLLPFGQKLWDYEVFEGLLSHFVNGPFLYSVGGGAVENRAWHPSII